MSLEHLLLLWYPSQSRCAKQPPSLSPRRCPVRKRGRGGQTQHRKELFGLETDSSGRIPCEGKRRCLAGSYLIWEGILPGVSGICGEESYREKYPTGRHPARGDAFGITGQTCRRKCSAVPSDFFGVAASWLLAFVLCVAPECCAEERPTAGG